MTVHDENGVYRSGTRERRIQRRKQLGVGLAGMAVFGAAGVFGMQAYTVAENTAASIQDHPVLRPRVPPTSPSPSPSVSRSRARDAASTGPGKVTRDGARQRTSPTPTPSPSLSVSASPGMTAAEAVNRHDESAPGATIRVTSAAFDLTGQPELAIVGDDGWTVGRARCTKTVRNDPGARPRVVPTTLVCWRVSPDRSVVTVATAARGRPSSGQTVAALEREWARLSPRG
ncbi:hypothetical protein KOI35_23325 [Actinoplanes bogorensis]|uniref:Uncharacterized protein n=1 Tax=Paractinoplanes bogorensis TaxID=1610840 RepID=A0ABS5YTQ3_9ACTN|nr:hypothetical protein [Actinoplanes bogorensis]MBU2666441.1 hypothetical protein [Actinoplanes bogorensis]